MEETGIPTLKSTNEVIAIAPQGVKIPDILLPCAEIDRSKWPVIACDQYTSQPEYWESVEKQVEGSPSSFNIILPELYLEHPGAIELDDRICRINQTMDRYLGEGILTDIGECMVLIDRSTPCTPSRKGLVLSIDLDKYDFDPAKKNLIRATEGTVLERIPPRARIRKDAPLEIPHVQLLVDDPKRSVIEPLAEQCANGEFELLYDIDLISGGGHLKGYRIPGNSPSAQRALEAMGSLDSLTEFGLLFAVGDGNHSLATAKAHWESLKGSVSPNHPARYALVELINIYDNGLHFEPIHRVLFHVRLDHFISNAPSLLPDAGIQISERMSVENAVLMAETIDPAVQPVPVITGKEAVVFTFSNPPSKLAVGSMQILIDMFLSQHPEGKVDYIHGEDAVLALSKTAIGMLYPSISKETFFETIVNEGVLPRKTFSMGESFEKRYYMECKMIVE